MEERVKGYCRYVCVIKGPMTGEQSGGWGRSSSQAPINTLIAAWQEQAVPVKDMLSH